LLQRLIFTFCKNASCCTIPIAAPYLLTTSLRLKVKPKISSPTQNGTRVMAVDDIRNLFEFLRSCLLHSSKDPVLVSGLKILILAFHQKLQRFGTDDIFDSGFGYVFFTIIIRNARKYLGFTPK
jgi:hypothetical protein